MVSYVQSALATAEGQRLRRSRHQLFTGVHAAAAPDGTQEGADDLEAAAFGLALVTKAMSICFPDGFLPIFSASHVRHFAALPAAPELLKASSIRTWRANLVQHDLIRRNRLFEDWHPHEVMHCLYSAYDPRIVDGDVWKIAPGDGACVCSAPFDPVARPELRRAQGERADLRGGQFRLPAATTLYSAVGCEDGCCGELSWRDLRLLRCTDLQYGRGDHRFRDPGGDRTYQQQCRDAQLNATLVGDFDRQLARALAALPTTRVMACPSRGETLANVVFETGLWAQNHGAIVLAPGRDGFPEQITDGRNGLLYPPDEDRALTAGLRRALALPEEEHRRIRRAAHARVVTERDAAGHLAALLARFFPPPAPGAGRLPGHPIPDARQPRSQATTSQLDPLEASR
ncbi:glycosyltransferase [Kitasatospora sp. NPDC056651]|uniref:glycosyltransferase n=1 Tax=Kitasatospora sp. NPDC056651 TaxID=3345892 RepID=UPI0036CA12ED